jgi:cytochrome c553
MKKFAVMGLALAGMFVAAGSVHAGDVEAGKAKFAVCMSCHGPTGQGQAIFPKIAGKPAADTIALLKRYKAGETLGAQTALMAPQAKMLSDEDMANLAAYIETL